MDLDGEGVKGMVTPGVMVLAHQVEVEAEIPESEHTRFGGLAARANFLAADRIDIIYAAKEVSRFVAKPSSLAMAALKRLGNYLQSHPRLVFSLPFQEAEGIEVYSDTDWSGCIRTRKSTSGGCMMVGGYVSKC